MRVNGWTMNVTEWANKSGSTDLNTRANGGLERPTDRVNCSMRMATSMRVNGLTTRLMELALIRTQMVLNMSASGGTTSSMDKALKLGLMALSTMASTLKERRMGVASLHSQMDLSTLVSFKWMKSRAQVYISGVTESNIQENGCKIRCTDMVT